MTPETLAAKAKESLDTANTLLATAMADAEKATPEEMQKVQAALATMKATCPCMPVMESANKALSEAFASLAKMGVPSTDAKNATRDQLVKGAVELHTKLTCCESSEDCQECDETEKTEEAAAPSKSS